jgi:hypothetical protein
MMTVERRNRGDGVRLTDSGRWSTREDKMSLGGHSNRGVAQDNQKWAQLVGADVGVRGAAWTPS